MAQIPGTKISDEATITALQQGDLLPVISTIGTYSNKKITASSLIGAAIDEVSKTIATGVVTPATWAPITIVTIDTEAAVASDNLDTITISDGKIIILQAADSARTVIIRHGVGNIYCAGAANFSLDHIRDKWIGFSTGGEVHEISRSNNA